MTMLVLQGGSAGSANFTLFAFSAIFFAENPFFLRSLAFWIYVVMVIIVMVVMVMLVLVMTAIVQLDLKDFVGA